ncbi:MAG: ribonuclease HII [Clostridia bacterium]|nr:ribonuclease HII [Clostridia bacterium]
MPDFILENELKQKGYNFICGVDEAGRGPLAGPVCAAAVILPENVIIEDLNDSKKLSEKRREELFPIILEKAVCTSVAFASVEEIEKLNILNATFLAMQRAVEGLKIPADFALIDGNRIPKLNISANAVVKGDGRSMSIAAASVLAKVSRDRLMLEYDKLYPQYNFAKHKGYGTKQHYEAIANYGICNIHRKSFLKGVI